jgi:Zn-dependent protease with chaperone function
MTNECFRELVARLEDRARRDPRGYKRRVLLLALLGNAYLLAVLAFVGVVFLVLLASILVLKALAIKLIVVVGVFLWVVVKALWLKMPPPQGTELRREDAPELFAVVDDLTRQLGAPRFHHVLIDDDFNAGVVQAPRLGIFGWYRNYLLIGLPLMKSLSLEQFRAVLGHELGHLAGGHGRLSNWIYRQRLRWSRLMAFLDAQESRGRWLFRRFLHWYAPYFNAYSFPLARANEYEADAASVRLTSAAAAAQALTGVSVIGGYLRERYWPGIHKQADDLPQPAYAPFAGMAGRFVSDLDEASAKHWLDQALALETTTDDTHPALKDRLGAIAARPQLSLPAADQTADRLLGNALPAITEAFDQRWRDVILPAWQRRHEEVRQARERLADLNAREGSLAEPELYERAQLLESRGNDAEGALAQFRALHARAPDNALYNFTLGTRLLSRDDDAGCALVTRAIELDEDAILPGSEALRDYYWRIGRKDEAQVWHARAAERAELVNAASLERQGFSLDDTLETHGLDEATLNRLLEQLRKIRGLRKAYLVRKRVAHLPHRPYFLLGFTVSGWWRLHSKARAVQVVDSISASVHFPGQTLIVNVEGEHYRFGRKLLWMTGSRIL